MIRIECPGCGVKLKAKAKLAGQRRKCPQCGASFVVPEAPHPTSAPEHETTGAKTAQAEKLIPAVLDHDLPPVKAPERLAPQNQYLVCTPERLFSTWRSNGQGWMLKTLAGFIRASRNQEILPSQGNFTLIELRIATIDGRHRLAGIRAYQLAASWALLSLGRQENEILSKIVGPGALNRSQKDSVRQYLRETLMAEIWHGSQQILDYLGNTDYHSQGVG